MVYTMNNTKPSSSTFAVIGTAALMLLAVGGAVRAQPRAVPPRVDHNRVKFYQDATNYEGIGIKLLINGLPVISDEKKGQGSGGEILNPYLLDEPNHITIILTPLKGAALPPARAVVDVQILETSEDSHGRPGPTRTVYHFKWKQKSPLTRAPSPVEGMLPPVHYAQPLNWQNAPRTPLTQADKAKINAQIKRFHEALNAKSLAQIAPLLSAKTDNMARALGQPAAALAASQGDFFAPDFAEPNWHMKPINYEHLVYQPGAEGRVIHVLNPDGSDPLSSMPDKNGSATMIDLYLAKIDGHWTFVL